MFKFSIGDAIPSTALNPPFLLLDGERQGFRGAAKSYKITSDFAQKGQTKIPAL